MLKEAVGAGFSAYAPKVIPVKVWLDLFNVHEAKIIHIQLITSITEPNEKVPSPHLIFSFF
jgi:hypothetical protein